MAIKNRTIFTGDNLPILRGMDTESVDLIYLDPPFNSNRHYSAPIGSGAAGAEFKDAWTFEDTDDAWWGELSEEQHVLYQVINAVGATGGEGSKAYLIYMATRLLEMRRVLKPTGSIYLHCDPTMSHSLKLAMDAIFGRKNFLNEIIWSYKTGGISKKWFGRKHDVILLYTKEQHKHKFNLKREGTYRTKGMNYDEDGKPYKTTKKGRLYFNPEGPALTDVWELPFLSTVSSERVGYPTQKPLTLLKRIIEASSNFGDTILDPFCGCATTCIAADILQRNWIGIDISPLAAELVIDRADREIGGLFKLIHRTDIPIRDAPPRSKNLKHILFGKQEGLCAGCKINFPFSNFTFDHIMPRSKGGPDTDDNMQLLCNYCNSLKGDRPMEYLMAKLKQRNQDSWLR